MIEVNKMSEMNITELFENTPEIQPLVELI